MSEEPKAGVGLDIGTMNLVSARKVGGSVQTKRMRDAFLDLDAGLKNMLEMSDMSYIEYDDKILVLGDPAFELAKMNVIDRDVRRPLSRGLISSEEVDALEVLSILIENVVGEPVVEGETCCYSVPANPIDVDRDNTYHENVFKRLLDELGYTPVPANEAMAIIFSECADSGFSGISLSFGAGMVNVAMAFKTISTLEFSIARGGDWIDEKTATAINSTPSKVCSMKESGVDINNPEDRKEEALVVYYKSLVDDALGLITDKFKESQSDVDLQEEVPIVVSGGTSLVGGFLPFFEEVFSEHEAGFPIDVSEVRHAEDPMTSVAQGLLVQAMQF